MNILITGENGTGKGVIAQAMHAISARAAKPFISVNMGGLPEGVFDSELFGHVRGAFTDARIDRAGRFELADGGTLFVDEIGNIQLGQQGMKGNSEGTPFSYASCAFLRPFTV